jgi:hypothetical protein
MTNETREALIDGMVDALLEQPQMFADLGEVIRRAAPLIAARRDLEALPDGIEP